MSEGVADSVREKFVSQMSLIGMIRFTRLHESGSMFTDDGLEYSEEDSLPPNSYEHSSEYEYSEAEYSEDYSYDYHTQEIEGDVTRTQVQQRSVAQVELSEQWNTGSFESTFNPSPAIPSPIPSENIEHIPAQQDVGLHKHDRPMVQRYQTQTIPQHKSTSFG